MRDLMCLHLAWYLASWGMLRNSFLAQHDHLIHRRAIAVLLEPRWERLWAADAETLSQPKQAAQVEQLGNELNRAYGEAANLDRDISDTLVTKILLGTLGCTPAYDRYFKTAARSYGRGLAQFGGRSVCALARLYLANQERFEPLRANCSAEGVEYPPMKMLDMCFFMDGLLREQGMVFAAGDCLVP